MQVIKFSALSMALTLAACLPAPSIADEVTTTTTRTTEQPGVVLRVPGVGVEVGGDDCATKTVRKTNEDTGSTTTKTKTNCD
jgi:hypothetical protein